MWIKKFILKVSKTKADDVPKVTVTPIPDKKPKPIKKRTGVIVKDHTKFEDE
jgi:hypothetical protein